MTAPFGTLYVGLVTPMDERGQIDEKALDLLIGYLLQRNIDGIALLTEAGEDPLLSHAEREALIERVGGKLKGNKQLLVTISAPSTRTAVDLARHAESKGATAVMLAPLMTPGLDYRALYRHVDRVARALQIPVYLTIRPNNALDGLAPEEIATLAEHERVTGVHLPIGSSGQIRGWARRMKDRGPVLTGCALAFSGAARAGASGVVCGLSMLATELAVESMSAVKAGEMDRIKKLERQTRPAVDMLGPPRSLEEADGVKKLAARLAKRPLTGAMPPLVPFGHIKEGLRLQGHKLKSFVRPPYEQVAGDQSDRLKAVLKSSGLLS